MQAQREGGSLILIAVRDCGTGLTGDKLDKIFQPFYTTKREGLSMGLSICRSIVEAHGGYLWAENNPDSGGATFSFILPVESAARDEGRGLRQDPEPERASERPGAQKLET